MSIHRRAFTLVEMLVVISIIGILMSLLLPAVSSVRAMGRSTVCKKNLTEIGTAYYLRDTDAKYPIAVASWPAEVKPYLDDLDSMLICPDGAADSGAAIKGLKVHVRDSTYAEYEGGHDLPFEPGPRCRICTEPQFDSYRTAGVTLYQFEDYSDWDWHDIVAAVDLSVPGKMKISFIWTKGHGYKYDLMYDGNVISSTWDMGSPPVTVNGGLHMSYGMNNRATYFKNDPQKILVLDYNSSIANVAGPDGDPVNDWQYVAPRHSGTVNVLFQGRHVVSMNADDIDPNDSQLHDKYWKPDNDAPRKK